MPFLPPNQQRQSTEDIAINSTEAKIKLSFQRADSTFSTWSLALSFLSRDAPQYLAHSVPLSFMSFLNFASAAATVVLFQVICFT